MRKVAVVFWSGTGNTEAMAAAVAQGVRDGGGEVMVKTAAEFTEAELDQFDAVAFGCPSMGAEELEETEFEPLFERCRGGIRGKRLGLFGSYGWGDGEWMRNWEEQVRADGADLVSNGVICNEAPDEEAVAACQSLGRALAS